MADTGIAFRYSYAGIWLGFGSKGRTFEPGALWLRSEVSPQNGLAFVAQCSSSLEQRHLMVEKTRVVMQE